MEPMEDHSFPADWSRERYPGTFNEFCDERRTDVLRARHEWAGTESDRPGGAAWKAFDEFASSFEEGDEIWLFTTGDGWKGYALVRGDRIVDGLFTIFTS